MIGKALYIISITICKLSILFQFLRIFVPTRYGNAVMFWCTTALMVLNVIFYIIEFFLNIMQCSPRARLWNREISGTCIGTSNIVYTAGFNVISDLIILILPLAKVWRLQMSMRRKLGISLIFSTGLMYASDRLSVPFADAVIEQLAPALCAFITVIILYTPTMSHIILHFWPLQCERHSKICVVSSKSLPLTFIRCSEQAVGVMVGCMPSLPRFSIQLKSKSSMAWSRLKARGSNAYRSSLYEQQLRPGTIYRESRVELNKIASRASAGGGSL